MEMDAGILSEIGLDDLGLMGRHVVQDDVNLTIRRLTSYKLTKERDEILARMTLGRLAQHFSTPSVECGVQRQRSVADVLEAVTLCTARREWQYRLSAVKRLNGGLLVNAEDGSV